MIDERRPWWASDDPDVDAVDPEVDPIEAHRTARRGDGDPPSDPGPAGDDGARDTDDAARPHGSDVGDHRPEICGVCPICVTARILGESRPELLDHLTEAARHLAAAVRAVVEPSPAGGQSPPGDRAGPKAHDREGRGGPSRVRRIDLD